MECAHEVCTCRVAAPGEFCSEGCGLVNPIETFAEMACPCEHPECDVSVVGAATLADEP